MAKMIDEVGLAKASIKSNLERRKKVDSLYEKFKHLGQKIDTKKSDEFMEDLSNFVGLEKDREELKKKLEDCTTSFGKIESSFNFIYTSIDAAINKSYSYIENIEASDEEELKLKSDFLKEHSTFKKDEMKKESSVEKDEEKVNGSDNEKDEVNDISFFEKLDKITASIDKLISEIDATISEIEEVLEDIENDLKSAEIKTKNNNSNIEKKVAHENVKSEENNNLKKEATHENNFNQESYEEVADDLGHIEEVANANIDPVSFFSDNTNGVKEEQVKKPEENAKKPQADWMDKIKNVTADADEDNEINIRM